MNAEQRITKMVDEFGPCNEASRRDLLMFLGEQWATAHPGISLLNNGRFRAHWGDAYGQQISIQFRGDHVVHVVLHFRPFGRGFISRLTARCLIDDVPGLLRVTHLHGLLTAYPSGQKDSET